MIIDELYFLIGAISIGVILLALIIVVIILGIKLSKTKDKAEEQVTDKVERRLNQMETVLQMKLMDFTKDTEMKVKEIQDEVGIILEGLTLAQTKDKLGLLKLLKSRKHLTEETVEKVEEEVKKIEEVVEENKEVIKKAYTPID